MTTKTSVNIRFVKCPRCRKILPELPDVPMYKCGWCGIVLEAKIRKPETNHTELPSQETDTTSKIQQDNVVGQIEDISSKDDSTESPNVELSPDEDNVHQDECDDSEELSHNRGISDGLSGSPDITSPRNEISPVEVQEYLENEPLGQSPERYPSKSDEHGEWTAGSNSSNEVPNSGEISLEAEAYSPEASEHVEQDNQSQLNQDYAVEQKKDEESQLASPKDDTLVDEVQNLPEYEDREGVLPENDERSGTSSTYQTGESSGEIKLVGPDSPSGIISHENDIISPSAELVGDDSNNLPVFRSSSAEKSKAPNASHSIHAPRSPSKGSLVSFYLTSEDEQPDHSPREVAPNFVRFSSMDTLGSSHPGDTSSELNFRPGSMASKPIPFIIQNPESSSEKPGRRLEEKYKVGEKPVIEQSLSPSSVHGVRQDQDAGSTSAGPSFPTVELKKENAAATSESMPDAELLSEEFSDRPEAVISEIQAVNEMKTVTDAEFSGEQQGTERTSLNAERRKHHEESVPIPDRLPFHEKGHYLVDVENNRLQLKLDNQIILIEDFTSPAPPNSSPVNPMLNLANQDLRELPKDPNYPKLLLLFLQRNKRLTLTDSIFNSMPDLCFLDISDTKIRNLPSSLFNLSKLKVLLLRNCVCLENLSPAIGNLKQMEVLDLSGTELYDLPNEIGELGLLRYMQLSFYGPDDESEYEHLPSRLVSPKFLSEIKEIRALSISVHPEDHRWTEIAAGIIEDINKLELLSYLHFYFPEVEMFENFIKMCPSWEKQKVSRFDFIVGQNVKRIASRVPDAVESLFNQEERCLRYVNGENASPWMMTMLIRVTAFYLDHHSEVQSLSEFGISNFRALKFCVVRECPKVQAILDENNAVSAFPCLEYLGIYFLWELKHIWKPSSSVGRLKRIFKTASPSGNFKALRYLIIITCPMLQFILWESMLQSLSNLEELLVEDCEQVEKIIKEENKKVKYEDGVHPGLKKLVLHYLPELVSLGDGVCLSEEKIDVYGCPKLILNSQP